MQLPKELTTVTSFSKSLAVILILIFTLIGFYIGVRYQQSQQVYQTQLIPSKPTKHKLQSITLSTNNLEDSQTTVTFSDVRSLYTMNLDGTNPALITDFPDKITALNVMPNGNFVLVQTRDVYDNQHFWILDKSSNNKHEVQAQEYFRYLDASQNSTRDEYIYTQETVAGMADILSDPLNGSNPEKIGILQKKLITPGCEGNPCPPKLFPSSFLPSFDGNLLLNEPPKGGGLGETAVVISRDGARIYPIDFYWYMSSAIWLTNNRLLTSKQGGQSNIIAFQANGTVSSVPLQLKITDYFGQNYLSPSGKYLVVGSAIYFFDSTKQTLSKIKEINNGAIQVLGWNKTSDKLMFSSTIPSKDSITGTTIINIYDVKTNENTVFARLNFKPEFDSNFPLGISPTFAIQ